MTNNNKAVLPRIKEYDASIEKLFVRMLYSNPFVFTKCQNIVKPHHYHNKECKNAIEFIVGYIEDHNDLPNKDQIEAVVGIEFESVSIENDESAKYWFFVEYENFAKYRQLEYLITVESSKLLKDNDYKTLLDLSKEAVEMGLSRDIGTDYFSDPVARLEELRKNQNVSTGFDLLDEKLYGGIELGTLNVICGVSGGGKSIALQNFAINHIKQGANVVVISLELSEALYSLRMDSMITGLGTRGVMRDIKNSSVQVLNFFRKHKGNAFIKRMPSGATSMDIQSFIHEVETQLDLDVNVLVVDYLDLCHPATTRFKADVWEKDKLVSEELRNLAIEKNLICYTASQLNRQSYEAVDLDGSHIAGGISKINTSDNVFAITSTPQMQKQGVFGLKMLKTRTSAGVGDNIDLGYDPVSMRIQNIDNSNVSNGAMTSAGFNVNNLLSKGGGSSDSDDDENSSGSNDNSQKSLTPMNAQDTKSQAQKLHSIINKVQKKND